MKKETELDRLECNKEALEGKLSYMTVFRHEIHPIQVYSESLLSADDIDYEFP